MGMDEGIGLGYAPVLAEGFLVHVVRSGNEYTVIVTGEFDLYASSAIEQQVLDFVAADATLIVDLQDVAFLDSTGLQTLWKLRIRQHEGGGRFVLQSPSLAVERVLRTTHLLDVFNIVTAGAPKRGF